jgi:uncharacterized membrane protein
MADMADGISSTKTPLWVRITLFVSIALNLLVAGAVAGFVFFGGPDGRADRERRDVGSLYTRALDPEDRRALRRDFVTGLSAQGREKDTIVSDMQSALDILRATPFDPDAFASALADQSNRRAGREELGRTALAARIASMSAADRAAYADRVESGLADLARRIRR